MRKDLMKCSVCSWTGAESETLPTSDNHLRKCPVCQLAVMPWKISYMDIIDEAGYVDLERVKKFGLNFGETSILLQKMAKSLNIQIAAVEKQIASLAMRLEAVQHSYRTLHLSFDKETGELKK